MDWPGGSVLVTGLYVLPGEPVAHTSGLLLRGYRATKDYIGLCWKYFGLLEGRLSQWLIIMGYFKPIVVYFGV